MNILSSDNLTNEKKNMPNFYGKMWKPWKVDFVGLMAKRN